MQLVIATVSRNKKEKEATSLQREEYNFLKVLEVFAMTLAIGGAGRGHMDYAEERTTPRATRVII